MNAESLLARLDGVRQVGPGRWVARCPSHEDTHPSLSVAVTDDGTILLHDFSGGCSAADIVRSVGLTLGDLFPRPFDRSPLTARERGEAWKASGWAAALPTANHAVLVVRIAASTLRRHEPLPPDFDAELERAAAQLDDCLAVLVP